MYIDVRRGGGGDGRGDGARGDMRRDTSGRQPTHTRLTRVSLVSLS